MPRSDREMGPEAATYLRKHGLNKVHDVIVMDERPGLLSVILMEEGEPDWSTSLNAYMLAEGLADLDEDTMKDDSTPEEGPSLVGLLCLLKFDMGYRILNSQRPQCQHLVWCIRKQYHHSSSFHYRRCLQCSRCGLAYQCHTSPNLLQE